MTHLLGKYFQHYKGDYYYVQSISIHTETEEVLVNYASLYGTDKYPYGQLWSRPLTTWNEHVDGKPRFMEVDEKDVPESVYNMMIFNLDGEKKIE